MSRPDDVAQQPATVAWEGKWLRIRVRGHWEYVERATADGLATLIVAVTPSDELLFVEQYRIPLQRRTIEFPAGLVGDVDATESLADSAARELLEETGWAAARVEVLMVGPTSSGLTTEQVAFCRASGLSKVHDGGGDESEAITVHTIPRTDAAAWLVRKQAEGYALDPKLWAGLWFATHNPDGTPL
jgi:ADP-ribose pyrophosphatase